MFTIKLKNPAAVEVKSIKASKHANSTQVHNTALLSIGYDCDVKPEKKHFIFVVDTSSSMKNKDVISNEDENISRIMAAKKAIFDIAHESDKKHFNNTYSMITFNKEAQVLLDGGDIYDLAKKKEDIKLDIGTSIYHGMLKIKELDSFGKTPKDNTIVILLSDGHSTLINEEKGICCLPDDVKRILKEKHPLVEYRFFDPKEVIDNLTYNDQCPRIFSMGIGLGYDEKYIGELSNVTNAALTHVKRQSDFTKPLHSGFFDIKPIPAIFEIQDGNEALSTKEVVFSLDKKILNTTGVTLYSGKDKEVVFNLDKKILNTLFTNGVVQVRVGNDIPSNISVDINQINKIDKRIALDFYRAKKADTLRLTNNVPLSLIWDIPQTDEFCEDQDCKEERKKLFEEIKITDREKMLQLRSSSSYIRPMGYITVIDPEVAQAMEKEKTHISPINLEVMMQPNSVLAFYEEDGYASVQTYNRDELFRLAKLNPEKDTRKTLTERFREVKIIDPIHGFI
ncbi:vWA domain-containing protein [Wolbachia endosymbiont of Bemisia tabaci]|uniref:vWA domain-containing protein n=1 Tax=Wolbachia endosymbiont of Bemisia tabaci TaxID=215173 RepID=UPI000D557D6E|nr:vWA domain-containing protein [Wolbachia endosymbiont of Bemisia tabaci]